MKKALAYMRVSGKGQEEGDGFDRQRIAIERYAAANGFTIEGWYQDVQTGRDEWGKRPGWSAMVSEIGAVRTILVEKLDRVARAVLVQELIIRDLSRREVSLITAAGDDAMDESPERVMFRQMLSVFAEYERASLVIKLRGARQRAREEKGRCEGRKPFGSRPGEADVIAMMQRLRKDGFTYAAIAGVLNESSVPTRGARTKATRWQPGSVYQILQREDQCLQPQ